MESGLLAGNEALSQSVSGMATVEVEQTNRTSTRRGVEECSP